MKIAIPTKNNNVDNHFGHCEFFTVYTVDNNQITNSDIVPSLQGCGCKSNIINDLKVIGVDLMLAGNMGQGAYNKITFANIKVIRGCSGNVSKLMDEYLAGNIKDALIMCNHNHVEGSDHQCNH